MLGQGGYGDGARWHLWIAVQHNDLELAEWCLAHGASANPPPAAAKTLPQGTMHEEAMRRGETDMAELFVRYGAPRTAVELSPVEALTAAAMRLDRDAVRAELARHADLTAAPQALDMAASENRADVVALLLDVGISPDVANRQNERPLHLAAYANALDVATLLIAHGAEIDPVESNWSNTPLGAAVYSQHQAMIDLLSRYSRDIWDLAYAGKLERLRDVLADDPDRARAASGGQHAAHVAPARRRVACDGVARLLLADGADPSPQDANGMTAADRAERLSMLDLAAMLRRASTPAARAAVERFQRGAVNLLDAYRTGTPEAMQRHWADTWHRRSWEAMRRYVQLDLGRPPAVEDDDVPITLGDARWLIARDNGFASWESFIAHTIEQAANPRPLASAPFRLLSKPTEELAPAVERTRDWDAAIEMIRARGLPGLDANGQMTDDVLERISRLEHVSVLRLGGSKHLTDAGVAHLARMTELRELDLGGCAISDRSLEILGRLPTLEKIGLWRTGISDAGVAHLAKSPRLVQVDLAWTPTGDGALRALAGKETLTHFRSGDHVTDEGLRALHDYPVFKSWRGGEVVLGLTSPEAQPNMLFLRGSLTDRGLATLVGLDGLFGLNVDDSNLAITPAGLGPLVSLPHLGFLAFDATDDAMPYIAAMPHLRFLMCQDTSAGDDGFVALGRSRSIEYIWGRRCHNLRSRGFAALAEIPTLRSLSVSCKNVDDAGLSALPRFPSLRELMPMDVPDDGYRHIGRCEKLESLVLMYCRETGDVATSHITGLANLEKYFASYTRATDRTLQFLAGIPSLESIDLSAIPGMTNAGVAALTALPRLRFLRLSGNAARRSRACPVVQPHRSRRAVAMNGRPDSGRRQHSARVRTRESCLVETDASNERRKPWGLADEVVLLAAQRCVGRPDRTEVGGSLQCIQRAGRVVHAHISERDDDLARRGARATFHLARHRERAVPLAGAAEQIREVPRHRRRRRSKVARQANGIVESVRRAERERREVDRGRHRRVDLERDLRLRDRVVDPAEGQVRVDDPRRRDAGNRVELLRGPQLRERILRAADGNEKSRILRVCRRVGRIERQRPTEFAAGRVPLPRVGVHHRERQMRLGLRAVERECAVGRLLDAIVEIGGRRAAKVGKVFEGLCQARVGRSEHGVLVDRNLKQVRGLGDRSTGQNEKARSQVCVVCFRIGRRAWRAGRPARARGIAGRAGPDSQTHRQRRRDGSGDAVFEREYVSRIAVIAILPDLGIVGGTRHLHSDPNPLAFATYAPLNDEARAERSADAARVEIAASLVLESPRSSRDLNPVHLSERRRQLIGHAVGEVLLRRVAADVGEAATPRARVWTASRSCSRRDRKQRTHRRRSVERLRPRLHLGRARGAALETRSVPPA